MRRALALAALLAALSVPALAAARDDDAPVRVNPIRRVVQLVKHLLANVLDDSWDVTVPKP